jgi:hypothetical protein
VQARAAEYLLLNRDAMEKYGREKYHHHFLVRWRYRLRTRRDSYPG